MAPVGPQGGGWQSGSSFWGAGAAAVATVVWGVSGIFVVLVSQPALVAALERLWLSVPLVVVLLLASGRRLYWPVLWR